MNKEIATLIWICFANFAAIILWAVYKTFFGGNALARKFGKLGNMSGMIYDEIVAEVGKPQGIRNFVTRDTNEEVMNVTWESGGYIIVLQFDSKTKKFKGIVSETAVSL